MESVIVRLNNRNPLVFLEHISLADIYAFYGTEMYQGIKMNISFKLHFQVA